jgi:hypothetical protein
MKYLQFLKPVILYYQGLVRQQRFYFFAGVIGSFLVCFGGMSWYFYAQSDELILQIRQAERLRGATASLLARYEQLQEAERLFIEKINQRKELSIKTYFERFIKEHSLTPEGNWAETEKNAIVDNELFEEEILRATFKNVSTELVVKILSDIEKEDIVEAKKVHLKKEGSAVTFDLVVAMKSYKKIVDEV